MRLKPKKTEILQVRVPHGLKRDFMDRCRLENRVASDVVRDLIEGYLARPVEILTSEKAVMIRRRYVYPTMAAAAVMGAMVTFLPNHGQAGTPLRAEFDGMDVNRDGFVSFEEFRSSPGGMLPDPSRVLTRPNPPGINLYGPDGRRLRMKLVPPAHPGQPEPPMPRAAEGEVVVTFEQMRRINFHNLETDYNQKLDFNEFREARLRSVRFRFDHADQDLDDRLTKAEYVAMEVRPLGADYVAKLTPERRTFYERKMIEQKERAGLKFDSLDANKDGFVSRKEGIPA